MILVGRLGSPYVRRTAILLDVIGVEFENRAISALADQEELRGINPLGRVPALIDGDAVLVDSVAIALTMLDRHDPEGALWPRGGPAMAEALQALFIANGALDKFVASYYERTRRPQELVHPPWRAHCEAQAHGGLDELERRFARLRPGAQGGPAPDYLDIVLATMITFMTSVDANFVDAARYPRLVDWSARCEKLPAFLRRKPG